MTRRLLNVAAVLSLLVALLLLIAGRAELPRRQWSIGNRNDDLALGVRRGRIELVQYTNGVFVAVPLSARFATLAFALAVWPLTWGAILYRQERRFRAEPQPMSADEVSSSPHRGLAVLSLALASGAWATLIIVAGSSNQPTFLIITVYVIAACALGVGVVASRRNKQFVAWRIVADFGIVLGLVLAILSVVTLYMVVNGIGFV